MVLLSGCAETRQPWPGVLRPGPCGSAGLRCLPCCSLSAVGMGPGEQSWQEQDDRYMHLI